MMFFFYYDSELCHFIFVPVCFDKKMFSYHFAVQINEPNAYGNTPLHVACYNGQDVVVNELIDCGANVNQVNEKGFAPLHFTAASRHGALCLELLVCNGADVNIKVSRTRKFTHIFGILVIGEKHVHVVIVVCVTQLPYVFWGASRCSDLLVCKMLL